MSTMYQINRHFNNGDRKVVDEYLTLEEAQAHCKDPETSSRTCTSADAIAITEEFGDWFDGYDEM